MYKSRNGSYLASLLLDFANNYELKCAIDSDQLGADLGIVVGGKLVHVKYNFELSGDSYEFGAAIADMSGPNRAELALKLLMSRPIRGITERVIDNRLVIVGGKDGLNRLSDTEVQSSFMDDVARIATYFKQTYDLFY